MSDISFVYDPEVSPRAISDLREAVGWDRLATDEPTELQGYWATVGVLDAKGKCVAWCALLSDGKYHGILLDVMVHPDWQRQGLGRALVAQAVAYMQAREIRTIHADFFPECAAFYEHCGFRVRSGGIYDGPKYP